MLTPNLLTTIPSKKEIQKAFEFSKNLDNDFLNKNYFNNLDLAFNIFQHFVENIDNDMELLKQNIKKSDYPAIKAIAHKIKNNFTYVGASNLSTLTKKIEIEASEEVASVQDTYNLFQFESTTTLNEISEQLELIKKYLEK